MGNWNECQDENDLENDGGNGNGGSGGSGGSESVHENESDDENVSGNANDVENASGNVSDVENVHEIDETVPGYENLFVAGPHQISP